MSVYSVNLVTTYNKQETEEAPKFCKIPSRLLQDYCKITARLLRDYCEINATLL